MYLNAILESRARSNGESIVHVFASLAVPDCLFDKDLVLEVPLSSLEMLILAEHDETTGSKQMSNGWLREHWVLTPASSRLVSCITPTYLGRRLTRKRTPCVQSIQNKETVKNNVSNEYFSRFQSYRHEFSTKSDADRRKRSARRIRFS